MTIDCYDDECVICYNTTSNKIKPCMHTVCKDCCQSWYYSSGNLLCPYCRQTILCFGKTNIEVDKYNICLHAPSPSKHYGITLCSMKDGVMVTKLNKNDCAYKGGLKIGFIITHINDIPIKCHENAISMFRSSKIFGSDLFLKTKKTSTFSGFLRKYQFYLNLY